MASGSSEGKTLDVSSLCENCTGSDAKYYCKQCGMDLCHDCERFHSKSNISKNHAVVLLEEKTTNTGTSKPTKSTCRQHGQKLEYLCETCFVTFCDQCKASHKKHNVVTLDVDSRLLHKICLQNIPSLMEILQAIENCDQQPRKLKLYKEAKLVIEKWRTEIKSTVDAEADRLLKDIDAQIQKHEVSLNNFDLDVARHKQELDSLMTKLHELRYTSDSSVIAEAVSDYNDTVDEIKEFLSDFDKSSETTTTVGHVLPFGHLIRNIEEEIRTVFTKISDIDDWKCENELQSLEDATLVDIISLDIDVQISECKDPANKTLTFYELRGKQLMTFNLETNDKNRYRCDKAINSMITLDSGEHIIIEYDGDHRRLHLLDRYFHVLDTLQNFKPGAICIESNVSFITKEFGGNSKKMSRFKRVVVRNGKMMSSHIGEVGVEALSKIMVFDRESNTVIVVENQKKLVLVKFDDMSYKRIDMKTYLKGDITYAAFNQKHIYIGDRYDCCIHISSLDGKYKDKLRVGKGELRGATKRGKRFIALEDKHVKIYSLD